MIKRTLLLLFVLALTTAQSCPYNLQQNCIDAACFWEYYYCSTTDLSSCPADQARIPVGNTTICITCQNTTQPVCNQDCPTYFWVPNTACAPCSFINSLCLYCHYNTTTSNGNCDVCIYPYIVDPLDPTNCKNGSCTIPNCQSCCTDEITCCTCRPGYIPSSDQKSCDKTNCTGQNCNPNKICPAGTYKNNITGQCDKCTDTGCDSCPNDICNGTCIPGYTWSVNQGKCVIICNIDHCACCPTSTTCSCCDTGYTAFNVGGSVKCCPNGTVLSLDNSTCRSTICPPGQQWDPVTQTCKVIICTPLQNCLYCTSTTSCICNNISTLINGKCVPNCLALVPDCTSCCDNTTCCGCNPNTTLNAVTNTCDPVCTIPDCCHCKTSTQCKYCCENYTLNADGTSCVPDCGIPHCLHCNFPNCSQCEPNYVLSQDCMSCILVCTPGFYPLTINGTDSCPKCSDVIPHCYLCSVGNVIVRSTVKCESCWDGWYLVDGKCKQCNQTISDCVTCNGPANCTRCNDTYVLYTNSIGASWCQTPPNCTVIGCALCIPTDSEKCHTCYPPLYVSADGKSCNYNNCTGTGQYFDPVTQTCVCPPATYLFNQICTNCQDPKCSACDVSGCNICIPGWFASAGKCHQCGTHCITCTNAYICIICGNGYQLLNNTCVYACGCNTGYTYDNISGTIVACPPGCSQCNYSPSGSFCVKPLPGYALDTNGDLMKCNSNCLTCANTDPNFCTSCEGARVLAALTSTSKICVGCTDAYATLCSPLNTAFSTACISGYSVFNGVCKECDPNCISCAVSGAGNCDDGKCYSGYVVIIGTHNCTACFGGCARCLINDPSVCLECSSLDYVDNSSQCQPCNTNCKTCTTLTGCTSCYPGYKHETDGWCYAIINFPCAQQFKNTCILCYAGYNLNSAHTCVGTISCPSTGCKACPAHYYLNASKKCAPCRTDATTCNYCDPSNTSQCLTCKAGYYFNGFSCISCANTDGCVNCTSEYTCTLAGAGYYLQQATDGSYTGNVNPCPSSCATCQSQICLTCAPSFVRVGTLCLYEQYVNLQLVLGPGPGTPWFTYNNTPAYNLAYAVQNSGQFMAALLQLAGLSETAFENIIIHLMTGGSIVANVSIAADQSSGQTAEELHQKITSTLDTVGIADYSVMQHSSTANTVTTGAGQGANIGLILGITIPLVILLIVVIVFIKIYSSGSDEKQTQETDKGVNEYEM